MDLMLRIKLLKIHKVKAEVVKKEGFFFHTFLV